MNRVLAAAVLLAAGALHASELHVTANSSVLLFDATTGDALGDLVNPGAGGLSFATGVAVGPDGLVYVSSSDTDQVLRYNGSNGAFIDVFLDDTDGLIGPQSLRFGPNGNLFVVNRFPNEVLEFTLAGGLDAIYATVGATRLLTPEDIAFGPDGMLYVASANTNQVLRYDLATQTPTVFLDASDGLDYPQGLAFDGGGDLFVSCFFNNEVLRFDSSGAALGQFAAVTSPVGLAFDDNGDLNVVSYGTGAIRRFDGTGTNVGSLTVPNDAAFMTVVDRPSIASVSRNPTSVVGGCQTSTITVTLDGPAPAGGVNVTFTSDIPEVTLPASGYIAEGDTSVAVVASTSPVAANVTATITARAFGSARVTYLTVKPVGLAAGINAVTLTPSTVAGGNSSTGNVFLFCAANIGDITVTLQSGDTGIATVPPSITIPFGSASGTFPITTSPQTSTVTVSISATLDRTQARTLTVTQAITVSSVTLAPSTVTGGLTSTGTATISAPAPAGGIVLSLTSSNGAATVPATTTVDEGSTVSNPFTVTTTAVATFTTASIRATFNSSWAARNLSIRPIGVATVSLSPATVSSGGTSTGTVTLQLPAAPGDVIVNLGTLDASIAAPDVLTITISAGSLTGTFGVTAGTVAVRSSTRITAGVTGTTTRNAAITVNP